MEKVEGGANRRGRVDSPMVDEAQVEKSFWLRRPDDEWVINRKTKKIDLLEFKRTSGWLQRRSLEIVGRRLRSRTNRPLCIYCKFFYENLFHTYSVFSPDICAALFKLGTIISPGNTHAAW
jgi:hypothetical protein